MLLGLGGLSEGSEFDMTVVGADADAGGGGVAAGDALRRFALAVVSGADPDELAEIRQVVGSAVGPAGLGDACGVVANFDGLTRIADATGTQLDEMLAQGVDAGLLGGLDTSHLQTRG